jgi:hypothetical protein
MWHERGRGRTFEYPDSAGYHSNDNTGVRSINPAGAYRKEVVAADFYPAGQ